MPERSNEISGFMVTPTIGRALIRVIFGAVADIYSLMAGFAVTSACIAYIFVLSFYKKNKA